MEDSIGCKGDFRVFGSGIYGESEDIGEVCNFCRVASSDHWKVPEGGKLFTVRVESVPQVQAIVERHNVRVAKINKRHGQSIGPASFTTVRTREVVKGTDLASGYGRGAKKVWMADLVVTAPRAIIEGWEICATLVGTDEGYLASRIINASLADVEPFAKRGGECDHCKAARRRNTTYVVREVGGQGEIKVVGSGCVKDFTGHRDPRSLIAYADCLSGLDDELDMVEDEEVSDGPSGGSRGFGTRAVSLVTYLAHVRVSLRIYGWLSRGKAREHGGMATAVRAWESMSNIHHAEWAKAKFEAEGNPVPDWALATLRGITVPTNEDHAQAGADLQLVEDTLAAKNLHDDFESNLSAAINQGYAFGRNLGIVAYICQHANKLRGEIAQKKAEAAQKDEWFGTEGKREVFTLKVVAVKDLDSGFREGLVTHLHVFSDAEGRRATWFATSQALDKNATYELKATVKRHETYKGKRQTILTRCSVVKKLNEATA